MRNMRRTAANKQKESETDGREENVATEYAGAHLGGEDGGGGLSRKGGGGCRSTSACKALATDPLLFTHLMQGHFKQGRQECGHWAQG